MFYVRTKVSLERSKEQCQSASLGVRNPLGLVSSTARGGVVGVSCPVQAKRVHFRWRILKE